MKTCNSSNKWIVSTMVRHEAWRRLQTWAFFSFQMEIAPEEFHWTFNPRTFNVLYFSTTSQRSVIEHAAINKISIRFVCRRSYRVLKFIVSIGTIFSRLAAEFNKEENKVWSEINVREERNGWQTGEYSLRYSSNRNERKIIYIVSSLLMKLITTSTQFAPTAKNNLFNSYYHSVIIWKVPLI